MSGPFFVSKITNPFVKAKNIIDNFFAIERYRRSSWLVFPHIKNVLLIVFSSDTVILDQPFKPLTELLNSHSHCILELFSIFELLDFLSGIASWWFLWWNQNILNDLDNTILCNDILNLNCRLCVDKNGDQPAEAADVNTQMLILKQSRKIDVVMSPWDILGFDTSL